EAWGILVALPSVCAAVVVWQCQPAAMAMVGIARSHPGEYPPRQARIDSRQAPLLAPHLLDPVPPATTDSPREGKIPDVQDHPHLRRALQARHPIGSASQGIGSSDAGQ